MTGIRPSMHLTGDVTGWTGWTGWMTGLKSFGLPNAHSVTQPEGSSRQKFLIFPGTPGRPYILSSAMRRTPYYHARESKAVLKDIAI
ncbi:uncharacterized protein EAE98_007826 [Botrytis deweyae]|uniref:Uncharacterized protein n=1 Tax=Botrytis deweyae TaxID=2478750 RepID=A0ABQ7IG44_9HELO|nr:uncharacterized protein EAE98_007826 [Botrytis deweyae]KAF7923121.1 hypothetical protein EAE98_007826 [Botrytis deweyae]